MRPGSVEKKITEQSKLLICIAKLHPLGKNYKTWFWCWAAHHGRGKEKKITKQLQNGAAGAGADKLQINLGVIVSSSDEIAS